MKRHYFTQLLAGVLAFTLALAPCAWADDTAQLKQQVQDLQNRVNQLQSELADRQQAPMAPVYDQWQWEDPFAQMMQMENNMRQAFANTEVFNPKMDMRQRDNAYIVTMDLPGMDKDKINVEAKQGMLVISGERRSEEENKSGANNQYYRQERSFGSFVQAIPLPDDARKDQIDAKYRNGVLTVTIPRLKKEEKNAGSGKITVQ